MTPRPNNPDEQSVHLHYMPRSLMARARAHAASLGITLKEWIIGLMERALGVTTESHSPVTQRTPPPTPIDRSDTVNPVAPVAPKPPVGRRDL
jgi:hypothetical protein